MYAARPGEPNSLSKANLDILSKRPKPEVVHIDRESLRYRNLKQGEKTSLPNGDPKGGGVLAPRNVLLFA